MRCEEFLRQLELDGDALGGDALAHAAACEACGRELERWRTVRRELHAMGEEPAPHFLAARVMAAVRAERPPSPAPGPAPRRLRAVPAIAVLAGAVLGGIMLARFLRPPAAQQLTTVAAAYEEQKGAPVPEPASPPAGPAATLVETQPQASRPQAEVAQRKAANRVGAIPRAVGGIAAPTAGPTRADAPETPSEQEPRAFPLGLADEARATAPTPEGAALQSPRATSGASDVSRARAASIDLDKREAPESARVVTVRLLGSDDVVALTLAIPEAEAPPPGDWWRLRIARDGSVAILGRDGADLARSRPATAKLVARAHLAAGEYRLAR